MSSQGTQSPPVEATSLVDPMGNVSVGGKKAQGVKDVDQRVDQFAEGKEQNIPAGGEQDITKATQAAKESAEALERNRP